MLWIVHSNKTAIADIWYSGLYYWNHQSGIHDFEVEEEQHVVLVWHLDEPMVKTTINLCTSPASIKTEIKSENKFSVWCLSINRHLTWCSRYSLFQHLMVKVQMLSCNLWVMSGTHTEN